MTAVATMLPASTDAPSGVDELVRGHLPLVGHLVRELAGRLPAHVNRDDLTSAGMMALVTSAQGFDDSRGVPFARFATIRIRGALTDELRSMDWASRGVRSRAREVDSARSELTAALGRTPRRDEIAQAMGVDVTELDNLEADVHRAATLSVEGLTETAGGDLIPSRDAGPEGLLIQREQIGLLHDAIAELPERLRIVIEAYFYGNQRMADIATDLGVTESRISQLRTEALIMLREGLAGQHAADDVASAPYAQRPGSAVTSLVNHADKVAADKGSKRPSRREAARQAYIAAIASRSTLAGRLAATTTLGDTRTESLEALRAAQ
jgi:RNA polymerase sigma factor FliA